MKDFDIKLIQFIDGLSIKKSTIYLFGLIVAFVLVNLVFVLYVPFLVNPRGGTKHSPLHIKAGLKLTNHYPDNDVFSESYLYWDDDTSKSIYPYKRYGIDSFYAPSNGVVSVPTEEGLHKLTIVVKYFFGYISIKHIFYYYVDSDNLNDFKKY